MKYEIVDLSKSLFQEAVLIEASSPKVAAEKHFGFAVERCVGQHGYILVASKSYPCRTYLYKRHLTKRAADAFQTCAFCGNLYIGDICQCWVNPSTQRR